MNRILYTLIAIIGFSISSFAQTGEIQGVVRDEKGEVVPFAQVVIVEDEAGTKMTGKGAKANASGRYTIKGLNPGKYNVMAKAIGKPKVIETDVQVYNGRPTNLDFKMGETSNVLKNVTVTGVKKNKKELINIFTPKENSLSEQEVKEVSVRDVNSMASTVGSVVSEDRGSGLNVGGARDGDNQIFIDGVKVTGSSSVPPSQISQLDIITSGVPAKYGDATGGVISITTKGPSNELKGSAEGITSSFLDPYGYNLLGFSLSGPIFRKKAEVDSFNPPIAGEKRKGPVALGFSIGGEFQYDKDRSPSIVGAYKVKDAKYQDLVDNPYEMSASGASVVSRQELLRSTDLEHINTHLNSDGMKIRLNGKLDYKIKKNGGNITLGGRMEYDKSNDFIERYSLLNYENNRVLVNYVYGGFLRLYQPLFNPDKQEGKLIKNLTMQLQVDYQRQGQEFYSAANQFDPWSYGYVGKFEETTKLNVTQVGDGSAASPIKYGPGAGDYIDFVQFYQILSTTPTDVIYTPGTINPLTANLTGKFIDLVKGTSLGSSIANLDNAGALVNGKRANVTLHNLFYPYGRVYPSMQKQNNNQYRFSGSFNFDIEPQDKEKTGNLNKHTLEVGFELEQRVNSQYNIVPTTLWNMATLSANAHLSVDQNNNFNPLLIMKDGSVKMRLQDYIKQKDDPAGIKFNLFDTIYYDKEVSNGKMSTFARNLRASLNKAETERINVNALDPSQMRLNMFSAEELLQNATISPSYVGYNIYGEQGPMNTTFNSFFTDKDKDGNYTRNVAPRMPFYAAGYIQDRFQLKDIAFNVGLRVDYYNANQYTFIDKYVPQGVRSAGEVSNLGEIPSTISKDAAVYVDDVDNPTKITGFRLGDRWFDKNGKELSSADYIVTESGGQIKPYLKGNTVAEKEMRNMESSTFDPNLMFKKASANINIMPRLNFTFKIDSNSLFFAHYDIMAQRPEQLRHLTSALDYYNLMLRSSGSINNPDLKSPKMTDLELGFKQRLSDKSSLTINFYYKEFYDQIQITKIVAAYPTAYNSFANTDFSTTKGFGLAYELRRMKGNNLRIRANYTMQFAEGTGSSSTSQLNLINANQGNLKVVAPLTSDVRHTFNVNFNYRFPGGDNYDGPRGGKKFLQDLGANLALRLMSGKPYSQQSNIFGAAYISTTDRAITIGDINSASMPWRYNIDFKIDKDFNLKVGKNKSKESGVDTRKTVGLNVYLNIQNLLNTQNVLSVYRFTGSAETDAYLTSPAAALDYASKEAITAGYGESFRDLYKIALQIPSNDRGSNYALPRIIWLGASLNF